MTEFETQVAEVLRLLSYDSDGGETVVSLDELVPRVAAAIDKSLEVLRMQGHRSVTESGTWWQHWEAYAHEAALRALRGETP